MHVTLYVNIYIFISTHKWLHPKYHHNPPYPTLSICKARNSSANIKRCAAEVWQSQVSLGRAHVVFPASFGKVTGKYWLVKGRASKSSSLHTTWSYLMLLVNLASGNGWPFPPVHVRFEKPQKYSAEFGQIGFCKTLTNCILLILFL